MPRRQPADKGNDNSSIYFPISDSVDISNRLHPDGARQQKPSSTEEENFSNSFPQHQADLHQTKIHQINARTTVDRWNQQHFVSLATNSSNKESKLRRNEPFLPHGGHNFRRFDPIYDDQRSPTFNQHNPTGQSNWYQGALPTENAPGKIFPSVVFNNNTSSHQNQQQRKKTTKSFTLKHQNQQEGVNLLQLHFLSEIHNHAHPQQRKYPHNLLPMEHQMSSTNLNVIGQKNRSIQRTNFFGHIESPVAPLQQNSTHFQALELQKKKNLKNLSTAPAPQSNENNLDSNDREKEEKAPLPQNLRGDPFRSAKVKTELCRHFGTAKGCPFGDKCNYAHGEHELKYTKLMDLERAGLVDIEIFRTHPCPIWVATGSCPFDQRCSGLHDPRIESRYSSWLPHAETLVNNVDTEANVDKLYHQQLSAVYSCSPIYDYIPKEKWKSSAECTHNAWRHLYAYVCNLSEQKSNWDYYMDDQVSLIDPSGYPLQQSFLPKNIHYSEFRQEYIRLLIAIAMRRTRTGQCYAYLPSHLFCGELCMVLQTRAFRVHEDVNFINEVACDPHNPPMSSDNLIVVREIAFGPVGDPGVRKIALWFNIQDDDLVFCTSQQAKRHKRSRHRLKRKKESPSHNAIFPQTTTTSNYFTANTSSTVRTSSISPVDTKLSASSDGDDNPRTIDTSEYVPFVNHQPVDNDSYNLINNILEHRSRVLHLWITWNMQEHSIQKSEIESLRLNEERLKNSFQSQRRHWLTWTWAINEGREDVTDETDVPPVDGSYFSKTHDEENMYTMFFHGKDDKKVQGEVISKFSKSITGLVWKSFLENMQSIKDEEKGRDDDIPKFSRKRRLLAFDTLSIGFYLDQNKRHLPRLKQALCIKSKISNEEKYVQQKEDQLQLINSLFREWNIVQDHYGTCIPITRSQSNEQSEHEQGLSQKEIT